MSKRFYWFISVNKKTNKGY